MTSRERMPEPSNPLGMDGIEFIEYATSQPQAFGDLLQRMGFVPLARHRTREVLLYRQGPMNLIVNSHGAATAMPTVSAVALRVRDAAFAHKHSLDLGAWDMPTRASAMELNIPGIHGVGDSLIYFVDRHGDFSIYDVDFVPLAGADPRPALLRRGASHPRRPHRRLAGLLSKPVRIFGAAAGQVFRHSAERHAARIPLPQVLSAADRAAARVGGDPLGRRLGASRPWRTRHTGGYAGSAGTRHRIRGPGDGATQPEGR